MRKTLIALFLATSACGFAQSEIRLFGDFNNDGEITAEDVTHLVNIAIGKEKAKVIKSNSTIEILDYDPFNGHEYVDLGIKDEQGRTIYWATCNIGAENPEDAGLYFAWGETVGYNKDAKHSFTYTPDCETDGNGVLKPEYDAAHVSWGGSWHMPTFDEWCNLYHACYLEWVTHYKGVSINGLVLYKAKAESDKGNFSSYNPSLSTNYSVDNDVHIFLPAAGYFTLDALSNSYFDSGTRGEYWSSSLSIMGSGMDYRGTDADHFHFHSTNYLIYNTGPYQGLTIRPVCVASE